MKQYLYLPKNFDKIIQIVAGKDYLLNPFNTTPEDIYNPAGYILNNRKNITYKLIIDNNILSHLLSAARSSKPNPNYRNAIALLSFCQYSEILIEPSLAIYEKINYDQNRIDDAINELKLFYKIDDNPYTDSLISYAIGDQNFIKINEKEKTNKSIENFKNWFNEFKILKNWKTFYLTILKIVEIEIYLQKDKEKFEELLKWMYEDFILAVIPVTYALLLFSSQRIPGMFKFKTDSSSIQKKKQVINMTWDIYIIDEYFRSLNKRTNNEEILFASEDNLVKKILIMTLEHSISNDYDVFLKHLPLSSVSMIDSYKNFHTRSGIRLSKDPNFEIESIRDQYIMQLEKKLDLFANVV